MCGGSEEHHKDYNEGHAYCDQGGYHAEQLFNQTVELLDSLDYYDDSDAREQAYDPSMGPIALIDEWADLKARADKLKDEENVLRRAIANTFFSDKEEGSATMKLGDGRSLGATFKINRTVSAEELQVLTPAFHEVGIPVDGLIKWKPELVVSAYRKLTDAQRAEFDQVLTIKEGMPSLEIREPKKKVNR
jgi:hypothetical protein